MSSCRSCGAQWPEGYAKCPHDGSALVSGLDFTQRSASGALAAATAHEDSDELAPGSPAGEYEIVQKIGEGGMGSVYGARHPLIGKRAAIKVIHRGLAESAEAVERFIREAQAVNQIGHPNIVDVFGFGQLPDGRRFFVMEWLLGESLKDRLARPLSVEQALAILEDIAQALEAAHDAGVLHRDLKPDNVFLQERKGDRPVVKLLDFGLAKLSGAGERGLDRTRTGVVMGTPLYLSPEQAKGAKVDFATDIYSLGAMAYEMFSGEVPFKADSAVETMAMHISQLAIPLARIKPGIPPAIDALVTRMLAKEAHLRPSIASVREEIAALRSPEAMRGRDSQPSTRNVVTSALARSDLALASTTATGAVPKSRRPPVALIAGLLALAGVGVTIAVVVMSRDPSPPSAPAPRPSATTTVTAATAVTVTPLPPDPAPEPAPDPAHAAGSALPAVPPVTPPEPERPTKPDVSRPAKLGTLEVTITGPRQADLLLDGKVVGKSVAKHKLTVAPGEHTVVAHAKGYKPRSVKVRVVAGRTQAVKLALDPQRSVNAVHDPFDDEEAR